MSPLVDGSTASNWRGNDSFPIRANLPLRCGRKRVEDREVKDLNAQMFRISAERQWTVRPSQAILTSRVEIDRTVEQAVLDGILLKPSVGSLFLAERAFILMPVGANFVPACF